MIILARVGSSWENSWGCQADSILPHYVGLIIHLCLICVFMLKYIYYAYDFLCVHYTYMKVLQVPRQCWEALVPCEAQFSPWEDCINSTAYSLLFSSRKIPKMYYGVRNTREVLTHLQYQMDAEAQMPLLVYSTEYWKHQWQVCTTLPRVFCEARITLIITLMPVQALWDHLKKLKTKRPTNQTKQCPQFKAN